MLDRISKLKTRLSATAMNFYKKILWLPWTKTLEQLLDFRENENQKLIHNIIKKAVVSAGVHNKERWHRKTVSHRTD